MSKSSKHKLALPQDLAACHALIEQLTFSVEEQQQQIEQLKLELVEALLRAFRKRAERYIEDPRQMLIDFGDSEDITDAVAGLSEAVEEVKQTIPEHQRRQPRRTSSERLPPHLPRYEVEVEASEEVKSCPAHGERNLIGYDMTETLELERPKLRVRVTKYPKYVCEGCEQCGVSSPQREPSLVAGNRYDSSIAAEIITAKYAYHLPIYRQQDCFAATGWIPSRSTLLNLLVAAAAVLQPLVKYFRQVVLDSGALGTDDTTVTLLLPQTIPKVIEGDAKSARVHEVIRLAKEEGKPSVTARMWAYRSLTVPLNVFDFTVSRHRDGPDLFLKDFAGKLMADCYSGYQGIELRTGGKVQRAACVAHARRKVFEAREAYPLESATLLAWFGQLYDIEDRAKTMSIEERMLLRQSESKRIWELLREWLESETALQLLPKSRLGEALGYLRNHLEALQLYLEDGRLPIDNNEVEQLMKQVAIGRKNWLFAGSVGGGERAADFLTLVSSAIRNDVEVWSYVKGVLDELLSGTTDYESLRPDVWKESHPESIRSYRVEERRDRADRKQRRRAARRRHRGRQR